MPSNEDRIEFLTAGAILLAEQYLECEEKDEQDGT